MKKILLTGSTGFIGSVALERLSLENKVYFISRNKIKNKYLKQNQIQIYYDSYNNLSYKLKKIKVDTVIHCATHYIKDHQETDIKKFGESNLIFGNIILENLKNMSVKKFVNFSTVWENYNGIKDNFFNLYSVYKRNFSNIILYYKKKNPKTKFYNLFISDTFGSKDNRLKIINLIKINYKKNKYTNVVSSNLFINLVNVEDIINALFLILKYRNQSGDYNLVNPKNFRMFDIVNIFNSYNSRKLKIKWLSKKIINKKIYKRDILKNWTPENSTIKDIVGLINS